MRFCHHLKGNMTKNNLGVPRIPFFFSLLQPIHKPMRGIFEPACYIAGTTFEQFCVVFAEFLKQPVRRRYQLKTGCNPFESWYKPVYIHRDIRNCFLFPHFVPQRMPVSVLSRQPCSPSFHLTTLKQQFLTQTRNTSPLQYVHPPLFLTVKDV